MLRGKKIIVIGLGITGLSCVRWLINAGAEVSIADSRERPPGLADFQVAYPTVPVYVGPLQYHLLQNYDMIIRSPGVSQAELAIQQAVKAGIEVVGDIELFARHIATWPSKVIAITGSNGKSTVTTMVSEMGREAGLKIVTAGNIGVPVLDTLWAIETGAMDLPDVFVLELSSFQLETTVSLNATAATVLNISEDHLDRYENIAEYAGTKARIFQGNGVMLLNRQDPLCVPMAEVDRVIRWFGYAPSDTADTYGLQQIAGEWVLLQGDTVLMSAAELAVSGLHNAVNALVAIALCDLLDIPRAASIRALKNFTGLAHRLQQVGVINGVTYYDDSKGTNVGATEAALQGMTQPVILIAGGQGKGQDFSPLKAVCAAHCRLVILLGQDAAQIEKALDKSVPIKQVASLEEAVMVAAKEAKPQESVVLSPACASLDMFTDYKQRGHVFSAAVQRLKEMQ